MLIGRFSAASAAVGDPKMAFFTLLPKREKNPETEFGERSETKRNAQTMH
jgi:hypothetical protein